MSSRSPRWIVALALTSLIATFAFTAGHVQDSSATDATPAVTPSIPAVVREVLAADLPAAAPGQELELVRYVIQPSTRLATHVHPGTQMASIESGVLTYTVLTGEVLILRTVSGGIPAPAGTIQAGQTTELRPGDAVVERPGAVHFGENRWDEPVVILAATLLVAGQPAAIPVNEQGTPES